MKKLWNKSKKLVSFAAAQKVGFHAAYASFFMVLAVFPSLILVLSLLRYTGLEVEDLIETVEGIVPMALLPAIQRLILNAYRNASGAVVSVSIAVALWSASLGVHGFIAGLNSVYHADENRGYLRTRGMSVLYTFLFLIVLQLTLVLHVFGRHLLELLPREGGFWMVLYNIIDSRFLVLFVLQTALFTAMFMVLPNRRHKFLESLPGALLATIGWQIFSNVFSVYIDVFGGYGNVYGSVYALALSMLWLYCCVSIVFYGGVLNYWLQERKMKEM